jgi:hypothetical protein
MSLTDLLDALGLLLIAAGLGFAASVLVGPAGLAVSGAVVLAGSYLAQRPARKPRGEP